MQRHETASERALTRALDRLERLQAVAEGRLRTGARDRHFGAAAQRERRKLKTVTTKSRSSLFSARAVIAMPATGALLSHNQESREVHRAGGVLGRAGRGLVDDP